MPLWMLTCPPQNPIDNRRSCQQSRDNAGTVGKKVKHVLASAIAHGALSPFVSVGKSNHNNPKNHIERRRQSSAFRFFSPQHVKDYSAGEPSEHYKVNDFVDVRNKRQVPHIRNRVGG